MKPGADWHKAFFRNSFYNPASPAAVAKAPAEAAFALRALGLKKSSPLLDLCCGPGRHAVEFARRGLAVTGYDYSREYLAEAAGRARQAGVPLALRRGDMRELPYRREFDGAVCLFTSFGYFPRLAEDLRTLRGVARSLKPGGGFLLDVINGDFVRKNFRPRGWTELDGYFLLEETRLERDGAVSAWTRLPKGGGRPVTRSFFTRLYDKSRISALLRKAGLEPLSFWGSFRGDPLSPDRDRLIVLARSSWA